MLEIDVVVRTLADKSRSKLLFRALDSIQTQSGVAARPIVVVNGQQVHRATFAALEKRHGILLHHEQQASTAHAITEGRRLVTAPYFSYLDDDDVLIPHSLLDPLRWFEAHANCDVLINNGFFVKQGGLLAESTHIADHINQPAVGLLHECWLSPGAFIFRTKSVPLDLLSTDWNHMEWTRLAFELCATHRILHFMDVPTVYYYDTPGSLSKTPEHQDTALRLLQLVRQDARMTGDVRAMAGKKYSNALHVLAMRYWQEGQYRHAWRYHLESMRPPHMLKYLLFTRKLLWPVERHRGTMRAKSS
jgi:hypothetical protein